MKRSGTARRHGRARLKAVAGLGLLLAVLMMTAATVSFASEAGGGHGTGWKATDTYRIMNFAVLLVVLVFLLRKPMSQALSARIKGIKDQLASLESQKAEAEKQLAQYSEKLSFLEKESEKIIAEYIKQGNEAKARILKEAEAAAEKLKVQARRSIENELERAKLSLQKDIMEKSLAKAEEMITTHISAKDQEQLVDDYLEKVGG
jgi:F-type H+-transporting ATPase subunit b